MDDTNEQARVLFGRHPLGSTGRYLGLITLNRPQEMNAMDWATVKELRAVLRDASAQEDVCVLALTGAGPAFSAGGDLKAYQNLYRDREAFGAFLRDTGETYDSLARCRQPVLALVNGFCVAGGLELMLGCDFAYAAQSAKIGDGHAKFGQVGGAGSNVRLPRRIAPARAREILFRGSLFTAQEALEWGLVNRVVPDGELLQAALEFANAAAVKSPLGLHLIKRISYEGLNLPLEEALALEMREVYDYALSSHDAYEGLIAFAEKRPPSFEGR